MKNKKGITFIEAIINIYVYVLLISVCMMVSISYIKNRAIIRQKQQAIEEISLTMNEMGKKIRMSECQEDCGGGKEIKINPNQGDLVAVEYNINDGLYYDGSDDGSGTKVLMLENVDGNFFITRADGIPLVTIELWKLDKKTNSEIPGTRVKTSVSMRSGYE